MKKNVFIIAFLMLLTVQTAYNSITLKAKDFCIKEDADCREKEFSVDCGLNYCSLNSWKCVNLQYLKSMARSLNGNEISKIFVKKYQHLVSSIKPCKIPKFNSSEICVRKKECFKRTRVPLRTGLSYYNKKVECLCERKEKKFKCGDYCSPNKQTCDQLKLYLAKNTSLYASYC